MSACDGGINTQRRSCQNEYLSEELETVQGLEGLEIYSNTLTLRLIMIQQKINLLERKFLIDDEITPVHPRPLSLKIVTYFEVATNI
jgi:hypothetical protein